MGSSIDRAYTSDPVRSLDNIRPKPAKADLTSDQIGLSVIAVTIDGILAHYGSVKAAAISLNADPSLLMREFKAGNFRLLERADEVAKASVFAYANNAFGPLTTPEARYRHLTRERQRIDNELDQLFDYSRRSA